MKKFLTIISLFSLISITAFSQSIGLGYSGGDISNGDTIVMATEDADAEFAIKFYISNNTSSSIDVKGKKAELSLVTGAENWFCDWISCYDPLTFVTPTALSLGATDTNKTFTADYASNHNAGTSFTMYTFWDVSNPNDSIAVVMKFMSGSGVGINTTKNITKVSNAYPNPAKNYFFIDYEFENAQSAQIQILNVLGSTVKTQYLANMNGKAKVDITKLNNGIYFYNVIVDGEKIASKKLVVR